MRVTYLKVQILRKSRQPSYEYSPSNYASHVKSASETRQSRVPPEKLRFVRDYRGWGASDDFTVWLGIATDTLSLTITPD